MSEKLDQPKERCPNCDSVVQPKAERCLMCGHYLQSPEETPAAPDDYPKLMGEIEAPETEAVTPESEQPQPVVPADVELLERQPESPTENSSLTLFPDQKRPSWLVLTIVGVALLMGCFGVTSWLFPTAVPVVWVPSPTAEPTSPLVPTATPSTAPSATPSGTPEISPTPTITPTPLPTNTPQPPRTHQVESGQTLVGLALLYDLTLQSILELNGFTNETLVFAGQDVLIPWPTATPPLQAVALEIGEATLIVDPSNCPPFYTIQEGDSLFFIAAQNDVPLDALLQINYLTLDSVVRPGDVICVPSVTEGGFLPPTPGPSPTPTSTRPPEGPRLLYPADQTVLSGSGPIGVEWLAVQPLLEQEWYMVELVDLTDRSAPPRRGFTRANSFQLPAEWAPPAGQPHRFSWRVSIVQVTGRRSDGGFIYTFGGAASQPREFTWEAS